LAKVATEEATVEFLRDFGRERGAVFDRPKVKATVGDERSIAGKRAGWTGVDAASAAETTFGVRRRIGDSGDGERVAEVFGRREPGRFGERRRD
jgi:hypothetical protein